MKKVESKEKYENVRIEGTLECLSPLSHIGETHSIGSFFNEEEILYNDHWVRIPIYTGNALRGMLRRCSRNHLCDTLGISLNDDWFAKLSYGGGSNDTDLLDVRKRHVERKLLPALSIFGYGLGNMQGKLCPQSLRLICKETENLIPEKYIDKKLFEARDFIGNQAFTRMDEFKSDAAIQKYLQIDTVDTTESGKRKVKDGESTTQMRYEVEIIKTGAKWYSRFDLFSVTELEIGAFITSIVEWSKTSRLGGMQNKGFGLVKSTFDFVNISTGEYIENFIYSNSNLIHLHEIAEEYHQKYDTFLRKDILQIIEKYKDTMLNHIDDISKLLGE